MMKGGEETRNKSTGSFATVSFTTRLGIEMQKKVGQVFSVWLCECVCNSSSSRREVKKKISGTDRSSGCVGGADDLS